VVVDLLAQLRREVAAPDPGGGDYGTLATNAALDTRSGIELVDMIADIAQVCPHALVTCILFFGDSSRRCRSRKNGER
jgi:hypothetical protein